MIKETVDLLGLKARDKVTGLEGVASSCCFDLYGCIQVALTPLSKDGELKNSHWFDVQRLEFRASRVMQVPDFDAKGMSPSDYDNGPAEKMPPKQ